MNDVRLLVPKQRPGKAFYPYASWWTAQWCRLGGRCRREHFFKNRAFTLLGRLFGFRLFPGKRRLIVLSAHRIERIAWPWNMFYEIIPVMWDLWPINRDAFVGWLKRNQVKIAFCTASQNVKYIHERIPEIDIRWMPEGIDVASYPCGPSLKERPTDLLNYGRQKKDLISKIDAHTWFKGFRFVIGRNKHTFGSFEELVKGIGQSKITICFPQCDTYAEQAGDVETLTQRYWECMLCGTVIVGRSPQELIEVCGYDPVVALGDDPCGKIEDILMNIDDYQALVDRNRATAERVAPWELRVKEIMDVVGATK